MKKIILTLMTVAAAAFGQQASAQFAYNFSKQTQAYTPLTGATSVTKGSLWNSDAVFEIPVGFSYKIAGITASKVYLQGGGGVTPQVAKVINGFSVLGTGLMDRGAQTMVARSDVRYTTTGTTGSRIFKLEVFNAGFEDEFNLYGELKDSISYQMWIYEGSNTVEMRFGPSRVSNFSDYFGPALVSGFMKNFDTVNQTFDAIYVAKGDPAAPTLDSFKSFANMKGLSSVPASGTVFRYTLKGGSTTGVTQVPAGTLAKVYPTQTTGQLYLEQSKTSPLQYALFSMNGQQVASGSAGNGRTAIDLGGLATGTYILRIADEAGNTFEGQKIIKQ